MLRDWTFWITLVIAATSIGFLTSWAFGNTIPVKIMVLVLVGVIIGSLVERHS